MKKVKKSLYFVSECNILPATFGRYGFYFKGNFGGNLSQKWLEKEGYTLRELTKEEAAAKYAAVKERQCKGEERLRKEREEYKQQQIQRVSRAYEAMLNGTPRNMSAERWYNWQDSLPSAT